MLVFAKILVEDLRDSLVADNHRLQMMNERIGGLRRSRAYAGVCALLNQSRDWRISGTEK